MEKIFSGSKAQNQPYVNPTPGEITLVGLGLFQTLDEKGNKILGQSLKAAQLLKDIGCNASQAQVAVGSNAPEFLGVKNSLDVCAKAGIIMIPKLGMVDGKSNAVLFSDSDYQEQYVIWENNWGLVAAKYKNYPALGGWFMVDEPKAVVMESFAKAKAEILKNDSSHVVIANLMAEYAPEVEGNLEAEHKQLNGTIEPRPKVTTPSTVPNLVNGFDEYYDYFDNVFGPAVWSSDLYPFGLGGGSPALDPEFYKYLLDMKTRASRTGRPFWTYVASNIKYPAVNGSFAGAASDSALTIGRLRFQMFMALAYGAQGICFWNIFFDQYNGYNLAPVDKDGNKTVLFDIIKTVNQEVKAYNSVFCGCNVSNLGVMVNKNVTTQTEGLPLIKPPYYVVRSAEFSPSTRWLFSMISNAGTMYLVIVNCDYINANNLKMTFIENNLTVRKCLGNGSFSSPIKTFNEVVDAGDAVIFRIM